MSEQDRGAYAPPNDAPLTFDPRHDGDRRGPAPLALIVSVLILIAIVAGLVVFYRHGVRKPGQPPQVVGAPIGDTKSAPLSSEAPSDATAGLQVYKTEQPPPGEGQTQAQPSLAPGPEEPQARPIARPPTPAPVAVAPLRAAEPAPAAPPPAKQIAVAKPQPVVAAPVSEKPPAPVKPAPVQAASAAKPVKPPKPAPVAVAAAAKPTPAAAPSGGILAQIGAFSSSALAEKGWSDAAHAAPHAMAGRSRKIEVTSRDGKTFYRALAGGFASKADVETFCTALHAAHTVCIVK